MHESGRILSSNEGWTEDRYRRISDILLPKDIEEGPLDSKVTNLVRILNPLGLRTMGSCQGHLDGNRFPFPWVTIWGLAVSSEMQADVQKVIDPFNVKSEIKWIAERALEPQSPAGNENELLKQQNSAEALARYLFKKYLRGKHPNKSRIFPWPFAYRFD